MVIALSLESMCFRALKILTHYLHQEEVRDGVNAAWSQLLHLGRKACKILLMSEWIKCVHILFHGIGMNYQMCVFDVFVFFRQEPASIASWRALRPQQQWTSLVSVGHPSSAVQYVIIAANDHVVIPLQDEGLTCGLDKLFELYWVCNLAYLLQVAAVFKFMGHVYGMQISGGKRSRIMELVAKLQVL